MRRALAIFLIALVPFWTAHGLQSYGWCGYALISGLPLLDGQLSVLQALTPPKSDRAQPDTLFQYRFNLAHTEVLIEGCFQAYPTRDVVSSLLLQVIPYDAKAMEPIVATIDFSKGSVTERDVVKLYIDQNLTYTIFEGSREESAARARYYLAEHLKDWEPPCDDC